jgi:hypothetical protein
VPNNVSAFFETLLAAEGEYNEAKMGQVALIDCVYQDISTESARVGKTVDIYFPDCGPMQNVGNGILSATAVNPGYFSLVFQNRVGKALQFQDFEQWQTATDLAKKFIGPLHKRAMEYLNGQICALANSTYFSSNAPQIGSKFQEVQVGDSTQAWGTLADQKVPMEDASKMHLAVHNQVYRNMIGDTAWTQESLVGIAIAQQARETGKLANTFNFTPVWDQQMPTASGSIIYGQLQPVNGSSTVVGTATAFTTDLVAGSSYLTFGCDSTQTQYLVTSILSDTQLTLASNYSGVTPQNAGVNTPTTARRITNLSGTVTATTSSATVSGSSTSFTTQLAVGQWLVFSSDATKTPYQVQAIASNTSLTLSTIAAAAANGSGQTATVQGYNSLAFHEYAIALALRPIFTPPEAGDVVDVTYLNLRGIPARVMVSYQHIYQALYVTIDYGYALGVMRPDFGVVIQT